MSRLDQHVMAVQNKLALDKFLGALARSLAAFAIAVCVAIVCDRWFQLRLPRAEIWFWSGMGAAGLLALSYAIWRRPGAMDAAVQIDKRLNTQDKFATALHVRTLTDPFAHAALLDAERTAVEVNLHKRFPLSFPRFTYLTLVAALLALSLHLWLNNADLFGRQEQAKKNVEAVAKVEQAKRQLNDALTQVSNVPKALEKDDAIKLAKEQLLQQLNQPVTDPARAARTAAKALQDVNEAIKQQVKSNQKYAEAQNDAKMMRQLQVPIDEKGPIADAQRELAKGNFNEAVTELQKAVENFDKMEKKDQAKAADQMKNMANQLQQMANDPAKKQQVQQQLQQMGMNPQQAQQMADQIQKAAQGDQQAQQQVQQMAQQAMKQMNNGQGPTQQQQQQMQQAMQQMQAQANGQQQAQQMAQAAKQMQQAMQQQAQQGQAQQGQKNQQGQQQQQQQMQQAAQQMQQQMQQMQAAAQDAQQIAAAQQAMQQAANGAMNQMNGQPGQQGGDMQGNQPGQNGQQGGQGGQQANGQPGGGNQPWNGQAGQAQGQGPGGQGAGDRSYKAQAPYGIKQEIDPTKEDEKGKILASMLVKASALKGESKEALKEVAAAANKDMADEIDQERVSRQAQRVVRDYFGSMEKDAEAPAKPDASPGPTTTPSN